MSTAAVIAFPARAPAVTGASATDRAASGTFKRTSPRHELEVAVDLVSDHNFFAGFSSNVSEGGLFVATHNLLEVGTRIDVSFALPNEDRPIRATAEVRWVREHNETSDTPPGMGLRFLELDELSAARVQRFVAKSREPLFYDDEDESL